VFLLYLYPALKAHEGTQLCTVAIGIISNISRALVPRIVSFSFLSLPTDTEDTI
jgi:importin subunit beta-1